VNDELEMMCKEAVVAEFKVLSQHLPGGTDEKSWSGYPVSGPRFEPETSRIRIRIVNHATTMLGVIGSCEHGSESSASVNGEACRPPEHLLL
jgi:hypothetical protein